MNEEICLPRGKRHDCRGWQGAPKVQGYHLLEGKAGILGNMVGRLQGQTIVNKKKDFVS